MKLKSIWDHQNTRSPECRGSFLQTLLVLRCTGALGHNIKIYAFLLIIALAGCRIDFNAQTIVQEDGSIHRRSAYTADNETDKGEIAMLYQLPEAGQWNEIMVSKNDPENKDYRYEAVRSIKHDQLPGSDFKRFNITKDAFAQNEFGVKVKNLWFAKWYQFDELYKDIVDMQKMENGFYDLLERFLGELSVRLKNDVTLPGLLDQMVIDVRNEYKPHIARIIEFIKIHRDNIESEEVKKQFENEFSGQFESDGIFTTEGIAAFISGRFAQFKDQEPKEKLKEAINISQEALQEDAQRVMEWAFGAHGLAFAREYNFAVSLNMPGELLKTNADKNENGTLIWKFDNYSLNRHLWAHSRILHPWRIAAVLFVFVLVAILLFRPKRT